MRWKSTVNIKKFLSEDDSPEAIESAYYGITGALENAKLQPSAEWKRYGGMAVENGDV